jgi:hypothetical protein
MVGLGTCVGKSAFRYWERAIEWTDWVVMAVGFVIQLA